MALGSQPRWTVRSADAQVGIDVGLRDYMLRVYNYMASGLALTGIVAYVAAFSGFYESIARTPLIWLVILAPLGLVHADELWRAADAGEHAAARLLALCRSDGPVARRWFSWSLPGPASLACSSSPPALSRAMSLYGYTTQRDLSQFGSFLFMGLIGIIIASLVNIFLASSALQFAISVIGVLVFTGLTAWDTQQIKEMYYEGDDAEMPARRRSWAHCALYLDFINLFMMLMQLLGTRRD